MNRTTKQTLKEAVGLAVAIVLFAGGIAVIVRWFG